MGDRAGPDSSVRILVRVVGLGEGVFSQFREEQECGNLSGFQS
jgi:hypothetical protein